MVCAFGHHWQRVSEPAPKEKITEEMYEGEWYRHVRKIQVVDVQCVWCAKYKTVEFNDDKTPTRGW